MSNKVGFVDLYNEVLGDVKGYMTESSESDSSESSFGERDEVMEKSSSSSNQSEKQDNVKTEM